MSRHADRARAGENRASLYDEITDKIINELEAGRVPWVQPWGTAAAKAPLSMPKNASTGRQYSGVNVLILWGAVIEHGFAGQSWLTLRQALSLGGHVRKGERGTTVVYADRFVPQDEKRRADETGDEVRAIPFLKRFTVFNSDQCDGLPDEIATAAPPPPPDLIEPTVEALIKATGIDFCQVDPLAGAAPLPGFPATGPVDEDAAHGLGGGGEEVAAAVPVPRLLDVHQSQVRLVDQRGRLQRLARLLLG